MSDVFHYCIAHQHSNTNTNQATKMTFTYDSLVLRNSGYVSKETQQRIRNCRLLIAGCGIGSTLAEAAARLGFERFIFADGDTVDNHNLNRQDYEAVDIGLPKVNGLARRIRNINPQTDIQQLNEPLTPDNVDDIVASSDIVFDTIDFLDLSGIVALHDACKKHGKPMITALSVGWGGACVYFPKGTAWTFRRLFQLPETGSVNNVSYTETFAHVIHKLAGVIDTQVVQVVRQALTIMEDGKPCPASQVSPGAFAVASLASTMIVRILSGQPVTEAPRMVIADMSTVLTSAGIDLTDP
jgi:molybdopterin-synthase adenylyltransferase